jgi:hypothetical protein
MKKAFVSFSIVAASLAAVTLTSCGDDKDEKKADVTDTTDEDTTSQDNNADNGEFQGEKRLPTPREFFEIIRQIGGKSQPELLMPVDKADQYTDNRMRALAFGVYSADIAYLSSFEIGTNTFVYLSTLEKIANAMDLGGIFDKELKDRMKKNDGNIDSLFALGDMAYYKSVEYLHFDQAEDVLGLMLAGAWVESMYIVTSTAGEFKADNPIFQNLEGQYLVLETIMEYLTPFMDDDMILQVYGSLDEIYQAYMSGGLSEESATTKTENGKVVLSGGQRVTLTAESYGKIVEKIKALRGLILTNEI